MPSGATYCPYCLSHKPVLSARLVGYQVVCRNCLATGPGKRFKKQALSAWQEQASRQRGALNGRPAAIPHKHPIINDRSLQVETPGQSTSKITLPKRRGGQ